MSVSTTKVNYGIDAPGVVRNLFLGGLAAFIIPMLFPIITIRSVVIDTRGLFWTAGGCTLGGILMLVYSLYGKYKHRDRMLNLINWRGNEQVLDIGTGKGLLMIGAAKRLTTGKAIGIDIWNAEDLTGNNMQNTIDNTIAEGVADKTQVLNQNAMDMGFADNTFDVILTNMTLHNIYDKSGRQKACAEIARVLKPGGMAVIADFRHAKEYKSNFDALGTPIELHRADYFRTFPAVSILVVKK